MRESARVAVRGRRAGLEADVFGLFGGKKKKEEAKAAPVKAEAPKAEAKAAKAAPAEKVAAKPAASAAAPQVAVSVGALGAEQVKLRLKLAAAKRAGQTAAAYAAAKGLADIQAKAGRRVGVRIWS